MIATKRIKKDRKQVQIKCTMLIEDEVLLR